MGSRLEESRGLHRTFSRLNIGLNTLLQVSTNVHGIRKNTFTTRKKRGTWRHLTLGMLCRQLSAHMLSTRLAQPSHKDLGTEHCRMTKRKEEKKQLEAATSHSFTRAAWGLVGAGEHPCNLEGRESPKFPNTGEQGPFLSSGQGLCAVKPLISRDTVNRIKRDRMLKWKPTRGNYEFEWRAWPLRECDNSVRVSDSGLSHTVSRSLKKLRQQAFWMQPLPQHHNIKKLRLHCWIICTITHSTGGKSQDFKVQFVGYQIAHSFHKTRMPLLKTFGDSNIHCVKSVLHFYEVKLQET